MNAVILIFVKDLIMKRVNMKRTILTVLATVVVLVIGITIGLNSDKIWGPKPNGPIITNVEMKETLKEKLVQTAYDYLEDKGLIEEYGIELDDTVKIRKYDNYDPSLMGSLTST